MSVTTSRILINRKEENELLRHWCDEVAGKGGQFSMQQMLIEGNWYTEYEICWPAGVEVPNGADSATERKS